MLVLGPAKRYTDSVHYRKLLQNHNSSQRASKFGRQRETSKMKPGNILRFQIVVLALFMGILLPAMAQIGAELQMAELSKKLQLTEEQKKELTPIVAERDKKIKALRADTSMGKLQKLRKGKELQADFRDQAAKHLNADQVKKLDALQAERRATLLGH
jgi:hypothetical protein